MYLIRRLLEYKELLYIFTWRHFTVRYRNTALGIIWAVIQPLVMMFLFTFLFTYVLKTGTGDTPKQIFFYASLLPWTFFSSSLNYSTSSLVGNYGIITKIYFPREILPLSGILVAVIDLLIASVIYLFMLIIFRIDITPNALWVFPIFILLFIFTVSCSFIFSCLNVYYRDVALLTNFIVRLLFFASPVLYSIDKLSLKLKMILFFNPLTFIIENMRRCVLEGRGVVLWQFAFATVLVLILFYFSHKLFIKTEKDFADVI